MDALPTREQAHEACERGLEHFERSGSVRPNRRPRLAGSGPPTSSDRTRLARRSSVSRRWMRRPATRLARRPGRRRASGGSRDERVTSTAAARSTRRRAETYERGHDRQRRAASRCTRAWIERRAGDPRRGKRCFVGGIASWTSRASVRTTRRCGDTLARLPVRAGSPRRGRGSCASGVRDRARPRTSSTSSTPMRSRLRPRARRGSAEEALTQMRSRCRARRDDRLRLHRARDRSLLRGDAHARLGEPDEAARLAVAGARAPRREGRRRCWRRGSASASRALGVALV